MDVNKHLAEKYNLTKDAFWRVHNRWILTHDACALIAEEEGIVFHEPQILVANENSSVAMYGRATLDKKEVWTTGEAAPENCKNSYFFAMAEKRWKDRATLMLIGVYHLGVYSDIEAEDFKKDNADQKETPSINEQVDGSKADGSETDGSETDGFETDGWETMRNETVGFGKHKELAWADVPSGYLEWLYGNATKETFKKRAESELDYRNINELED